ncbi:MAG: DUF3501 family protein [Alphaproteobacteria bacterium]|nr:DUF3501 family protein [Alphaproteobacteria bacterium]
MAAKTEITRDDIMAVEDYARERRQRRTRVAAIKKDRRMDVGPYASFYFENYETMWHQIHEMLYIERGGAEQVEDELRAYNPLIPKGRELVATIMFEIPDETLRRSILARLGGVEDTIFIALGDDTIAARPEADVDRTTADGKASSVQFVHFPFTGEQVARFTEPATQVIVGIKHPNYAHMAVMPDNVRAALSEDFD